MIEVQRPKEWDPVKLVKKLGQGEYWSQPKIDGCRAYNPEGTLLARTKKQYANRHVTAMFSNPLYIGLDGEMAAAEANHPALCRLTTSAITTIDSTPTLTWHLFDYLTEDTLELCYRYRYAMLEARICDLYNAGHKQLRLVPYIVCKTLQDIEDADAHWLDLGYEGSCIYNPRMVHKQGPSSAAHGGVNRIKRFIDGEAIVLKVIEGETNNNEAQINELGRTFRTSHQENKSPNGMIGALLCKSIGPVIDPQTKAILIADGDEFIISAGALTHQERAYYLTNPEKILGQIVKFHFFPKGIKDKPRFPAFTSFRAAVDLF